MAVLIAPVVGSATLTMFVVELAAVITTLAWLTQVFGGQSTTAGDPAWYTLAISLWLWVTALIANLAERVVEGRGRAQAEALRATRRKTQARMRRRCRQGGDRAEPW